MTLLLPHREPDPGEGYSCAACGVTDRRHGMYGPPGEHPDRWYCGEHAAPAWEQYRRGMRTAHKLQIAAASVICVTPPGRRRDALCWELALTERARAERLASRFGNTPEQRTNLVGHALEGLFQAARRYDPDRGIGFWAYAQHRARLHVRQAMQAEYAADMPVHTRRWKRDATLVRRYTERLTAAGASATAEEIAEAAGLTPERVREVQQLPTTVALEEGVEVADTMEHDLEDRETRRHVWRALSVLDARDRAIVCASYGIGRPAATTKEIAAAAGLHPRYVRELRRRALERLAEEL